MELLDLLDEEPLKIKCSSTNCPAGEHYYGPHRLRKKSPYEIGRCSDCGVDLVDWDRVHQRVGNDVEYTFQMLRTECWRHEWWHRRFDSKALENARQKGRLQLDDACLRRLRASIRRPAGAWDGRQTKYTGNVLFYAQHATATCCRKCVQYWHGIPMDRELSPEELDYMAALVLRYIDLRLPNLNSEPMKQKSHSPNRENKE